MSTSYELSEQATLNLRDAVLAAMEARMNYNIAPRMVSPASALEEAKDWVETKLGYAVYEAEMLLYRRQNGKT